MAAIAEPQPKRATSMADLDFNFYGENASVLSLEDLGDLPVRHANGGQQFHEFRKFESFCGLDDAQVGPSGSGEVDNRELAPTNSPKAYSHSTQHRQDEAPVSLSNKREVQQ